MFLYKWKKKEERRKYEEMVWKIENLRQFNTIIIAPHRGMTHISF